MVMKFVSLLNVDNQEENRLLKEKIRELEQKLESQEKSHIEALSNKKKDLRLAVNLLEKGKNTLLEERKSKKSLEEKLAFYEAKVKCNKAKIDCYEEKIEFYEEELVSVNAKLVCSEIKKASYEQQLLHHRREEKQDKSDCFEKYLLPSPSPSKEDSVDTENTFERKYYTQFET